MIPHLLSLVEPCVPNSFVISLSLSLSRSLTRSSVVHPTRVGSKTRAKSSSISHHVQMSGNSACISSRCSCVIGRQLQTAAHERDLPGHASVGQTRPSNASCMLPSNRGALSHAPAWQRRLVHALVFAEHEIKPAVRSDV